MNAQEAQAMKAFTDNFLTVTAAAVPLNLAPATVRQMVQKKQLAVVKVGKSIFVARSEISALAKRRSERAIERANSIAKKAAQVKAKAEANAKAKAVAAAKAAAAAKEAAARVKAQSQPEK